MRANEKPFCRFNITKTTKGTKVFAFFKLFINTMPV